MCTLYVICLTCCVHFLVYLYIIYIYIYIQQQNSPKKYLKKKLKSEYIYANTLQIRLYLNSINTNMSQYFIN